MSRLSKNGAVAVGHLWMLTLRRFTGLMICGGKNSVKMAVCHGLCIAAAGIHDCSFSKNASHFSCFKRKA
jgi:hypothetical protein